jgi:uncharacterized protein
MTDSSDVPIGPRRAAMWIHLAGAACAPLAIALPWFITTQLSHGGIGAFVAPYMGLLLPVVTWRLLRSSHPFVDENGRNVVNFHLSMAVFVTIFLLTSALAITSLCGGFPLHMNKPVTLLTNTGLFIFGIALLLLPAQGLSSSYLSVYGAIRGAKGQVYRYPFSLNFFKARL